MRFNSNNGFTLVEIVVVLIILALAGSLVFVNVGRSVSVKREKVFMHRMISQCRKARRTAVDEGVPMAFYISSSQRASWIEGSKERNEFPKDMGVQGEGITRLSEDVFAIRFYPDGSSDGGELTLTLLETPVYAFKVDILTGALTQFVRASE